MKWPECQTEVNHILSWATVDLTWKIGNVQLSDRLIPEQSKSFAILEYLKERRRKKGWTAGTQGDTRRMNLATGSTPVISRLISRTQALVEEIRDRELGKSSKSS